MNLKGFLILILFVSSQHLNAKDDPKIRKVIFNCRSGTNVSSSGLYNFLDEEGYFYANLGLHKNFDQDDQEPSHNTDKYGNIRQIIYPDLVYQDEYGWERLETVVITFSKTPSSLKCKEQGKIDCRIGAYYSGCGKIRTYFSQD